jgi:hypothetical protein
MAGWRERRLGFDVEIAHLRSGRDSFSGAWQNPYAEQVERQAPAWVDRMLPA